MAPFKAIGRTSCHKIDSDISILMSIKTMKSINLRILGRILSKHHSLNHSILVRASQSIPNQCSFSTQGPTEASKIVEGSDSGSAGCYNSTLDVPKKRLDVAIVGAPNAGKSQLLNVLTQSTVAAVSRKRHTTRSGILGARTIEDTQLVFWDTPGFLKVESAKREGLDRDLMVAATAEMENVDYSILVVDAARNLVDSYRDSMVTLMAHALRSQGRDETDRFLDQQDDFTLEKPLEPFAIVLNKVDLVHPKENLLDMADELGNMAEACIVHYLEQQLLENEDNSSTLADLFPPIFYTDAIKGEGTQDLLKHLEQLATPSLVWPVEKGEVTIMSPLERVEEVIREKVFRTLHQEIPHAVRQVNRHFAQRSDGMIVEIQQDIVVRSKSHYSIIAGRNLAAIQQAAQKELETTVFPQSKVVLFLHLKLNKTQRDRHSQSNMQGTVELFRRRR